MAYVLSLRPHSPLKRSFSDNPYLTSCSPLKDVTIGALRDITSRNASACSLYSLGSNRAGDWLRGTENTPPLASCSLLDLVPEKEGNGIHAGLNDNGPRKRGCGLNRPTLSFSRIPTSTNPSSRRTRVTTRETEPMIVDSNTDDDTDFFNLYDAIHIPLPEGRWSDNTASEAHGEQAVAISDNVNLQPFRRWVSTLRRRHIHRRKDPTSEVPTLAVETIEDVTMLFPPIVPMTGTMRRFSDSMSSSLGHGGALGSIIDEGAWVRSVQRRKIVEELISTEESYIADLKVLVNDYFTLLSGIPALPAHTRASIQQNISQILQLHEDLLAELHQVIPQADFTQSTHQETYPVTKAKHIRFHSADLMPGRFAEHKITRRLRHSLDIGRSPDRRPQGLVTDTKTIGEIARIFNKHMKRFFTYEEYGAHWTTMSQDLTATCKGLHGWHEYERGVEALSKVVASENNRTTSSRKALSFPDLLIKPIQRVCKYPLLFGDLCRHTPVYDDPEAHGEVEKALFRLQETIREVNKAKDDPKTRRLIEITWQLQDRLMFQEQTISRALIFRLLGHVLVCGVLHVAYQTSDRVKGQYMVCVLYKSCLVLANAGRFFTPYSVIASIALANGSIEETDNGRGLQCHTAPYSWKLVFEHGHRLHEIILSACSSHEEEVWKKQLRQRIVCETHDFVEGQSTMQDMFSSLSLDIKSIGPVFGHADSLVRRMSVHRAATLGSKTQLTQVIIKNTQAQKSPEPPPPFAPNLVTRSQSHLSTSHVPTLAPRRAERIRLETALEDVWTKDILPFPGMSNRRVENQIRASANSVMRKLSMASIASNFSRRSPSFSSVSNTRSEDSNSSKVHKMSHGNLRGHAIADRRPAPAVVDFHNAPAAFLPTDFELQDTRPSSRRRRLANRAAGTERWSEKSTPGKPKRTRRLSSHLISLPGTDTSSRVESRRTSMASHTTAPHPTEPVFETTKNQENEKQKRKDSATKRVVWFTPTSEKVFEEQKQDLQVLGIVSNDER
ncbi:hypothetical protein N0V90_009154 [Kalmusia sp. IMI 367209]|nr:hypothetical protein N0V90_009154 [Kalmusia sp. IMI 367209]